jgi:N6-adenosine-specific RNA methylase IME4
VNLIAERKREHSRKPERLYDVIEQCSPGPRLELFARAERPGWSQWGNELGTYEPTFSSAAYDSDRQLPLAEIAATAGLAVRSPVTEG